jgi:hypothetical protein
LRITSTGAVGIGVTGPSELLHVNGNAIVEDSLLLQRLQSSDNLSVLTFSDTLSGSKGNNLSLGNPGGFDLLFHTGGVEKARIDSSGRLLVGTSTSRNVGSSGATLVQLESTGYRFLSTVQNSNDAFGSQFYLGKSRGTATGSATVVQNNDEIGYFAFAAADGTDVEGVCAAITAFIDGTPGNNDLPGRLVFSVTRDGSASPTEAARISATGEVSTFSAGVNTAIFNSSSAAGTTDNILLGRHSATGYNTGTASFAVYTNGNVVNTNNSYTGISDVKLKENIVDASSQWNDLKALQVRNYNFKEGQTHTQIGLIAQEIELISPGLVSESPDRDAEGNDLGTVTKSVNYSVLYMKAVKALQEAMERIESLEAKVAALEAL